MIVTARQLEDLHRGNGHVTLPRMARLTPLAQDWIKSKRIAIRYDDGTSIRRAVEQPCCAAANEGSVSSVSGSAPATLWWCDGPCGAAKAAIVALSREMDLGELPIPQDARQIVGVIRHLAAEIKARRATTGILLVKTGAPAVVYANRCPSLRAILGTCLDAVEQGVQQVAANVLIVEHPYQTMSQVRNMVARFARAGRELPGEVKQQLQELASCG